MSETKFRKFIPFWAIASLIATLAACNDNTLAPTTVNAPTSQIGATATALLPETVRPTLATQRTMLKAGPQKWAEVAQSFLQQGNPMAAAKAAEIAITQNPTFVANLGNAGSAHGQVGVKLLSQNKLDEAEQEFFASVVRLREAYRQDILQGNLADVSTDRQWLAGSLSHYVLWPRVNLLMAGILLIAAGCLSLALALRARVPDKWQWVLTWAVPISLVAVALTAYLLTVGRTVGAADTFEFQVVAPTLGIAHQVGSHFGTDAFHGQPPGGGCPLLSPIPPPNHGLLE